MQASVSSFGKVNSYILGANLVWRFCILWVPSIAKALSNIVVMALNNF